MMSKISDIFWKLYAAVALAVVLYAGMDFNKIGESLIVIRRDEVEKKAYQTYTIGSDLQDTRTGEQPIVEVHFKDSPTKVTGFADLSMIRGVLRLSTLHTDTGIVETIEIPESNIQYIPQSSRRRGKSWNPKRQSLRRWDHPRPSDRRRVVRPRPAAPLARMPLTGRVLPVRAGSTTLAVVAWLVEPDLAAAHQQPERDRQIKTVGVLLEIGRSDVAKRTSSRAFSAES